MLYLHTDENNEIIEVSLNKKSKLQVGDTFFSEYPVPAWKVVDDVLTLKENADEIRDTAIAEKAAKIEANRIKELKETITKEIQKFLDTAAQEKGYDSIISACSYVGSANFGAEGKSFLDWRDAVWTYVYQVEDDVENEVRTEPTLEELLVELPQRILPE